MDKFNILIGTHGRFGEELIQSASMIVGPMKNIKVCSLLPEYSFEEYLKNVDTVINEIDSSFTIALVDLYGGTPCNTFTILSKKYNFDVFTGLNMPILIDLYLKLINFDEIDKNKLFTDIEDTYSHGCIHTTCDIK